MRRSNLKLPSMRRALCGLAVPMISEYSLPALLRRSQPIHRDKASPPFHSGCFKLSHEFFRGDSPIGPFGEQTTADVRKPSEPLLAVKRPLGTRSHLHNRQNGFGLRQILGGLKISWTARPNQQACPAPISLCCFGELGIGSRAVKAVTGLFARPEILSVCLEDSRKHNAQLWIKRDAHYASVAIYQGMPDPSKSATQHDGRSFRP